MQIAARYKAVWELMQAVFADTQPADKIINTYFRERRFIGSGDRRFISEKIWDVIRHRRRLQFEAQSDNPRKMLLVYLKEENLEEIFAGGTYGLKELDSSEQQWLKSLEEKPYPQAVEAECPDWLFAKIRNVDLLKALNQTATADFRVNHGTRAKVMEQMTEEGFEVFPTPYSPLGIRSEKRININNCMAYQEGAIEVQDEASQLAALLCDVSATDRTVDYCCGAGGKSLAIASSLKGQGLIEAHDIDPKRLEQLPSRMARLGIKNIKTVSQIYENPVYSRFIIDAPCSGTGTWRRSPDAKFRLTEQKLAGLNHAQAEILETAYRATVSGGRIIYITCSILEQENQDIVTAFMQKHTDIQTIDMTKLWQQKTGQAPLTNEKRWLCLNPMTSSTDGFFVCVMQKI